MNTNTVVPDIQPLRIPVLAWVRREVEALPPEQKQAVMLVCVNNLSYQDAAAELGIAKDVLVKHLSLGRLTLANRLRINQ